MPHEDPNSKPSEHFKFGGETMDIRTLNATAQSARKSSWARWKPSFRSCFKAAMCSRSDGEGSEDRPVGRGCLTQTTGVSG